jgi:hypothetical protein
MILIIVADSSLYKFSTNFLQQEMFAKTAYKTYGIYELKGWHKCISRYSHYFSTLKILQER